MPYYDTIDEDLERARQILADGTPSMEELRVISGLGDAHADTLMRMGGTIYGKDIYAAYKLLESFVAEIERLRTTYTRTHITWDAAGVRLVNGVPDGVTAPVCACGTVMVCPDIGCDHNKGVTDAR